MKTLTIALLIGSAGMIACSSGKVGSVDSGQISIVEHSTRDNALVYLMGEEKRYELKEISMDKSSPRMQQQAQHLYDVARSIDSSVNVTITLLNNRRIELLKSTGAITARGAKSTIMKHSASEPLEPLQFNLENVPETTGSVSITAAEKEELKTSLQDLRKFISETVVSSSGSDTRVYSFKDPNIHTFTDQKDAYSKIRKSIEENNVSLDDAESLARIYIGLTYAETFWESTITEESSWITVFGVLTNLEHDILTARFSAFSLLNSRVGSCEYGFNKIIPVSYGPEIIKAGEEVDYTVLVVAFDSDKQPVVKSNAGTVLDSKEGKGYVRYKSTKPGKFLLKGTVTILNKSGIAKTMEWEKEIRVIP